MKKFTFKAAAILLMIVAFTNLNAQVKPGAKGSETIRCGTMEALNQMIKADPTVSAKWKAAGDKLVAEAQKQQQNGTANKTTSITYIPIVLHVIATAAQQATLTDEVLRRQVDVLNRDFGGLNPDSVNIPAAFKPLFGHSEVRFVLARRTPTGAATNGIERLTSAATFTQGTYNNMKHNSTGGLDQWDGNKYYNVWLGTFTDGLLGIATFPNTGNANEQGVCIHWGSVDLPCGSPFAGAFDGGRTLVHETGHYMYLFHIWGDDGTACTGNDWGTPYGALPASCTDDTPNQGGPTSGCFTGVHTDACSPTAPGFMYQNYMDYTDDPCYAMFTVNQACRIQGCLDNHRASLKTSDGATPVTANNNDARVSEILNPKSRGFACGAIANFCNPFAPQVMLVNAGDATLNSVTVEEKVNGVTVSTTNLTGLGLAPGDFKYVNLPVVNSPGGAQTLTVKTSLPNGAADGNPANDSANAKFSQTGVAGVPGPINEGFESTTFPPPTPAPGWTITNSDGGITWARSTAAAKTGVASAFMNFYNYAASGQIDYLVSPKLTTTGADVVQVDFDVAYAPFSATFSDGLDVVYSTDCGVTWIPTSYSKSGTVLATNGGGFVTGVFTPTAAQWRHETVSILLGCGPAVPALTIGFRARNGYGNQLYVDNVQIQTTAGAANNLQADALTGIPAIVCPSSGLNGVISPTFSFRNLGTSTVTSTTIKAIIDGAAPITVQNWTGSLAKCNVTSVALGNITIPGGGGNHTVKIYTDKPNGTADLIPSNDTLSATFYVVEALTLPHTQGFESATFPPANGWRLFNPDAGITWTRTTAAAKTGAASLFMNHYAYTTDDAVDILATPIIPTGAYDTINVTFDYAHANFDAVLTDTLEMVYSTDCGATWLPTGWKKGGAQLATNGGAFVTGSFTPTAAQWASGSFFLSTCSIPSTNVTLGIKSINGYGNNTYVDNFTITGVASYAVNAATLNIIDPPPAICNTTFTPKVTIGNFGAAPLTSVTINYAVDGGAPATFTYTNAAGLARCSTAVVTLNPVTSSFGNHVLTVYTTNPNGTPDLYKPNDTARKAFSISPTLATPQTEGFEGTAFPPTNWSVQNPDGLITWSRATPNARTGTGSMVIRNFNYTVENTEDRFYSPVIINNASIDSQFVAFDYAYVQGAQYPGSTVRPLDTLELMVTTDCGVTFKSVWKKWGQDLQTVSDPNYVYTNAFSPSNSAEWKNIKIYLTPFVGTSNYQVYWVAKSNRQNNLYIDNINISSKTLPIKLKNQGYDIYPNPFNASFRIHHWVAPVDLTSAQVFTSAGQLVWERRYNGDANTEITVDMDKLAKGVYVLKMIYTNKTIVEKLVKN